MKLCFRVRVEQDEDGMFVVECPNLPGCISQGETKAEALKNIKEAKEELEKRGLWHWQIKGLVGPNSDQVFVQDPFGNVIELHQAGSCSCNKIAIQN